jgi:hypothetical protein
MKEQEMTCPVETISGEVIDAVRIWKGCDEGSWVLQDQKKRFWTIDYPGAKAYTHWILKQGRDVNGTWVIGGPKR